MLLKLQQHFRADFGMRHAGATFVLSTIKKRLGRKMRIKWVAQYHLAHGLSSAYVHSVVQRAARGASITYSNLNATRFVARFRLF
jgi:hypothetical protein